MNTAVGIPKQLCSWVPAFAGMTILTRLIKLEKPGTKDRQKEQRK